MRREKRRRRRRRYSKTGREEGVKGKEGEYKGKRKKNVKEGEAEDIKVFLVMYPLFFVLAEKEENFKGEEEEGKKDVKKRGRGGE
jgi:hypothetical protein